MDLPADLGVLPEGFRILKGERGVLVVRDEYSASLVEAGFGPDGGTDLPASDVAGRQPLGALEVKGEELLVRFHKHGGLLRFLTSERFLDRGRVFKELLLAERLAALGVPTPKLVAARSQRSWGVFSRLALVSVRVPGALDLARVLREASSAEELRPLMRAMGELVGRLHRIGLLHVDLHPGNMLVQKDWRSAPAPQLWILDLDRCELQNPLESKQRWAMLARLARYGLRRSALARVTLGATQLMRFMGGYRLGLDAPDGSSDSKQDWSAVAGLLAEAGRRHRLGWRLEELVGAGANTRQGQ